MQERQRKAEMEVRRKKEETEMLHQMEIDRRAAERLQVRKGYSQVRLVVA